MNTQRAIFSLKGTNINLPTRYKIRKFRPGKTKSQKPQQLDPQELAFIIEAKQTIPIQMHHKQSRLIRISQNNPEDNRLPKRDNQELTSMQHSKTRIGNNKTVKTFEEVLRVEKQKIEKVREENQELSQPMSLLRKGREHCSSMKSKRCTCGNCEECMKDFAYFLHLFSDNQNLPEITAKSWCIWRKKTNGKYMHYYGKRIHKVREIASLTKMVTAITAMDFLAKYSWSPQNIFYEIKKTSTLIGGTSANLEEGQLCSLLELFYGMMLPSGNDAAIAVSEAIGLLAFVKGRGKLINPEKSDWYKPYTKCHSYLFIGMMNERCQKSGTLDTKFFNSHGNDAYDQLKNISTCNQIAKIASQFMSYPLLRQIVKTPKYGPYQNTNKLLEDGFDGIKTGITETAGPCLASSYKDLIIVVLNSKSMNQRWMEVKKLVKWILKKS